MRIRPCAALLLIAGALSAADTVQVIALTNTANEQSLVPASVLFTRNGSGSALTVQYRISGTAHSSLHQGSIAQVQLLTAGAGYLDPAVPLTFSGGTPTVLPSGTADGQGGQVASVTLTDGGDNFSSAPTVTITGTGQGATATAVLSGYVSGITKSAGGSGYTVGDTVDLSGGGGSGAAAHVSSVTSGAVNTIQVDARGSNYTTAPNVGFNGGTGAAAAASISYEIGRIDVASGGQGYTSAGLSLSGGGGSGVVASVVLTGSSVSGVTLSDSGYGYVMPTVTLSGGGGSGASVNPVITNGAVTSLAIENAGNGYTSAPTVSFSSGVAAATASIDANGRVSGFTITAGGSGYGPTVTANDTYTGGETQATFAAVLAGPDYEAPAGSSIDPITGDLIGTITFAANSQYASLSLAPHRNGVGGARAAVISIDPSPIGNYSVNQQSSANLSVADADVQATIGVTRPVAYPTLPTIPSAILPLEVQGRGEWLIQLNDSNLFRSVAVEVAGDAEVAPQAVLDTDYWLGFGFVSIAATATDYATVVPVDPSVSPLPAAPGIGASTIAVSSLAYFNGGEIVIFENPTNVLNGIYTVTAVTGPTSTTNPTITISPALKLIQTSYGSTRVRRIAERIMAPTTGTLRNTVYSSQAAQYYYAFPTITANAAQARKSINLTMVQNDDYRTLSPTSGTVTLADDTVTVGVRLVSNAGKPDTNGVFEVVLNHVFPTAIDVPYIVLNGSATLSVNPNLPSALEDFTISGITGATGLGSIHIPANTSTASIVVQPFSNADLTTESFTLQLLASPDYLLAPSGTSQVNPAASMSISPEPRTLSGAPVYVTIDSVTVAEEDGTATLTVSLSDDSGAPLIGDTLVTGPSVGFTISGSATADADYTTPASFTLSMADGSSSASIVIPIIDDRLVENDETISINLLPGSLYQLSAMTTGTVTIQDNEPSMAVLAPASGPVEGGAATTFTINVSRNVEVATVVSYQVGGTASAGIDYATLAGTVTVPIGQRTATVAVSASTDLISDSGETVTLTLLPDATTPATYKLGATTTASMTITEPSAPVIATITAVATEPTATQAPVPVSGQIRLSADRTASASNAALNVVLTVGGTAVPGLGASYVPLPASVVFEELVTTTTALAGTGYLTAQVVGGGTTVLPAGCVLRVGTGATTVTVLTAITVGAAPTVISLLTPLVAAVPVATSVGVSTAVLPVTPVGSVISANGQTVVVTLAPVTGDPWTAGASASATVTIASGYPGMSITAGGTLPVEGGVNGTFTVTASQAVAVSTSVAYTISGTATAGADYTALSGVATISVGGTSTTISVVALTDSALDPGETVILTLGSDPATVTTYHLAGSGTSASLTIDEAPTVSIATVTAVATTAIAVQAEPPVSGQVTIYADRTGSTSNAALTVPLTVGGTAVPGTTYTALPASVVLAELVTTADSPAGAAFIYAQAVGGASIDLPAGTILRIGTGVVARVVSTSTTVETTQTVIPLVTALSADVLTGTSVGVASISVAVTPISDAANANGQTVQVGLPIGGTNWTVGAPTSATVTIGNAASGGVTLPPKGASGSSSGGGGCGAGGLAGLLLAGMAIIGLRRRRV